MSGLMNWVSSGETRWGMTNRAWLVLAVIATGVATEIFRYTIAIPTIGFAVYIVHLGVVLSLFLTLPYSKFAHIFYRSLAMVHERMTAKLPSEQPPPGQ